MDNKIKYLEIITSLLLSGMAILVSFSQCSIAKEQNKLRRHHDQLDRLINKEDKEIIRAMQRNIDDAVRDIRNTFL